MSTAGKGGRRLVKKLIHTAKKVVTDPTTRQFVGQAAQAAQAAQKAFYSFSNDYHNRQISRSGGRPTTRHAKSTSTVSQKLSIVQILTAKLILVKLCGRGWSSKTTPKKAKTAPY